MTDIDLGRDSRFSWRGCALFHNGKERSDKMAFDAFVKIDEIEGESRDEGHSGWIEVIGPLP
jgi:hypothetical protein